MEVNETIKPNIINDLDLTFSFSTLGVSLNDTKLLSFLEKSLGKGLITMKLRFKLIILKF